MKRTFAYALLTSLLVLSACKKKQETTTIITSIQPVTVSDEIKTVNTGVQSQQLEWGGALYEVEINTQADKEAPVVTDDDGNRYYENKINLQMSGPSGVIFERIFSKDDFASCINANYLKPSRSTLTSLVFSRLSDGNVLFVASVGSPNEMDDEYMLAQVAITKNGTMTLSKLDEEE